MLKRLWARYFGVEGAALTSKRIVFFYTVYQDAKGWYFSWRSEDYLQGAVHGPYAARTDALSVWLRWKDSLTSGQVAVAG